MSTERLEPPAAKRIPTERTHHGDIVVDEYAWLADKENPDTIAFLEAENAYTEVMTAGQAGLRETIFGEIKGRTKETDLSVPTRKRGWWYYDRTVEGQQYAVNCRRAVRSDGERPPMTEDGSPLDGEEILLDGTSSPATSLTSRSAPSASARTAPSSRTPPTTRATSGTPCG